jgi:hypothetical protein
MKYIVFCFLLGFFTESFSQTKKISEVPPDSDAVVIKKFESSDFFYYVCSIPDSLRSRGDTSTLLLYVLKTYHGDNVPEEAVKSIYLGEKMVYLDTLGTYFKGVSLFQRIKMTEIERVMLDKKTGRIRYDVFKKEDERQTLNELGWATAGTALTAVVITIIIVVGNTR